MSAAKITGHRQSFYLDVVVYVVLAGCIAYGLITGPIAKWSSNEVRFRELSASDSGDAVPLPCFAVCRTRNARVGCSSNNSNSSSCVFDEATASDPAKMSSITIENRKGIEDFFAVGYIMDLSYSMQNGGVDKLPLNASDFKEIPGDVNVGNCFELNLETVPGSRETIEKLGSSASLMIKFKENNKNGERSTYIYSMYEQGDHYSAGFNLRDEATFSTKVAEQGITYALGLYVRIVKKIRDCETNEELWPLSRCLDNYVDSTFGICPYNGSAEEDYTEQCSNGDNAVRLVAMGMLKLNRDASLTSRTGCRSPCQRTLYELRDMYHYSTAANPDSLVGGTVDFANQNTTILGIRIPMAEEAKVLEQVIAYDMDTFVSDLGGLTGLFLGLSFWTVWGSIKEFILKTFFKKR